MFMLKNGYNTEWHENIINSVVIFRGLFGLAYPGWAISITGTILAGLWGFVHGFVAGFLIAFLYNIFGSIVSLICINEPKKVCAKYNPTKPPFPFI